MGWRYPLHRPTLGPEETAAVAEVLASAYLVMGPRVAAFEAGIARVCGSEHAIAVSSGTAALHLLCRAMGTSVSDGVVVPAFGFPASANAVELCGGRAQGADVDPETFAVTAASVEAAATAATVGVMAVHPFGIPAPMDELDALCRANGWWLIEDAACALGTETSQWNSHPACLSFHPRKTLTTAEGGAILVDDGELAGRLRTLRNQGIDVALEGWERFSEAGFNYRMSDVHAAIGVAQLDRLEGIVAQRRRVAAWYRDALTAVPGVRWAKGYDQDGLSVQSMVVEWQGAKARDGMIAALAERGVQTTIGGYAAFEQPYYRGRYGDATAERCSVSSRLARNSLTLPVLGSMSESDVGQVCAAILECGQ